MSISAAVAIPALIAAASTGAGMYMQNRAMNKARQRQQREREYAMRVNRDASGKNMLTTVQTAQQNTGANRVKDYAEAGQENTEQLKDYLNLARPDSIGSGYGGKVSGDFTRGTANSEKGSVIRANRLAGLFGRMNAAQDLYRTNAERMAEAAIEKDITSAEARDKLRTSDLAIQNIQPSGTSMMLGELLKLGGTVAAGQIGAGSGTTAGWKGGAGLGAGDFAGMPSISPRQMIFRGFGR